MGEDLPEINTYHHAKFHADRCHLAEISVTTQKKHKTNDISDKSHSVVFVR